MIYALILIAVIAAFVTIVRYMARLHLNAIEDKDKNFIPDDIDDRREGVKSGLKEVANAIMGDNPQTDESKKK